jgi:hypothetical protein
MVVPPAHRWLLDRTLCFHYLADVDAPRKCPVKPCELRAILSLILDHSTAFMVSSQNTDAHRTLSYRTRTACEPLHRLSFLSTGGTPLRLNESDLDAFCQWLCEREHAMVGRPGMIFHCPLALWMSELTGHIYGVDGCRYGRACSAYQRWLVLPRWAEVFVAWSESVAFRPITGAQALTILAGVEMALHTLESPRPERRQGQV